MDVKGSWTNAEYLMLMAVLTIISVGVIYGASSLEVGPWKEEEQVNSADVLDTVTGTVLDASTGDAVNNAQVTLSDDSTYVDNTDSNGKYEMSNVVAGDYTVEVVGPSSNYYKTETSTTVTKEYTGPRPTVMIKGLGDSEIWQIGTLTFDNDVKGLTVDEAKSVDNSATKENVYIELGSSGSDAKAYNTTLDISVDSNASLLADDPSIEMSNYSLNVENDYDSGADYSIDVGDLQDEDTGMIEIQWTTTGGNASQNGKTIGINAEFDDSAPVQGENASSVSKSLDIEFA